MTPDMLTIAHIFFLLLLGIGVLAYLLRRQLQARGLLALHLLSFLVSLLGLLILTPDRPLWIGGAIAAAMVGCFWLMARFENTDRG